MVAPVRRRPAARAGQPSVDDLDRLVAGRSATGDALEQPDLSRRGTSRRGRPQPRRAGRRSPRRPRRRRLGPASDARGSGLSSMAQPASRNAASTDAARAMSSGCADPHVEPQGPGPSRRRECPGAADRDVERPARRCRHAGRLGGGPDPILERRTQEAEGQVEAVEAHPSDVTAAARDAVGANPLDERGDLRFGRRAGRAPR